LSPGGGIAPGFRNFSKAAIPRLPTATRAGMMVRGLCSSVHYNLLYRTNPFRGQDLLK